MHFHIRHINEDDNLINNNDKYNFMKNIKKNYDLEFYKVQQTYDNKKSFFEKLLRFKTFILYFFPRFKFIINNLFKKEKHSVFSFYFLAIMEIAIGTSGLKNKFDKNYWDIFTSAIENGSFIHTALNYENVEQYFQMAHEEGN